MNGSKRRGQIKYGALRRSINDCGDNNMMILQFVNS